MLIKELVSLKEIKYSDTLDPKYNNLPENVKTAIIKLDNLAKNIYKKYSASGNINNHIAIYIASAYDPDIETFKDNIEEARSPLEDFFHLNFDKYSRFNQRFEDGLDEIFAEMFGDNDDD